jgi:hypothetical protein
VQVSHHNPGPSSGQDFCAWRQKPLAVAKTLVRVFESVRKP